MLAEELASFSLRLVHLVTTSGPLGLAIPVVAYLNYRALNRFLDCFAF